MRLVVAVLVTVIAGVFVIVETSQLASLVDRAFIGKEGLSTLHDGITVVIIIITLRIIVSSVGEYLALLAAAHVKRDLRIALIKKLGDLGPHYAKGEFRGELLTTLIDGVEQLETYIAKYIPQAVLSAALPFAIWCVVFEYDMTTLWILSITLPLLIFFMILVGWSSRMKANEQFQTLQRLSGHLLDVLRGLPTLTIYQRVKAQTDIIGRVSESYRQTTMATLRIAFLSAFVMELFATLSTAMVAVFLGLRLIDGQIDFYRAFYLLLLVPEFYNPIRNVGMQYHAAQNGMEAMKRMLAILDTPNPGWSESCNEAASQNTISTLIFNDVSSTVGGLHHLSFSIRKGEWVAIVGASGAGKSTLFDLICGWIRPSHGEIQLGDSMVSNDTIGAWRKNIAIVSQTPDFVEGTIAEQLNMYNPLATDHTMKDVARLALCADWIEQLPMQYETQITEEIRLSGGQIQRLMLARALLAARPILLLDEAFSQLDVETASEIQHALVRWKNEKNDERTIIAIAHHIEQATCADRIFVMENGTFIDSGSHDVLLKRCDLYKNLWAIQNETKEMTPHHA